MKFTGKYDTLIESTITRFEQGGLLSGDLVRFRKDALKHDKVKSLTAQYKAMIEYAMNTDLNLRVGAIKSTRPTTTGNYGGGMNAGTRAPTDHFVDIVIEYAPGLWRDPITVPMEVLERVETNGNLAPVPDSLKRKSKNTKPQDVESPDNDRKTPTANTKPQFPNKTTDGKTQAKKPKEVKKKNQGKLTLEDVYGQMSGVNPGAAAGAAAGAADGTGNGRRRYKLTFGKPYGNSPDEMIKRLQTMPKVSNNMTPKVIDDKTIELSDLETELEPEEFQNMATGMIDGGVTVIDADKEEGQLTTMSKKPTVVTSTGTMGA